MSLLDALLLEEPTPPPTPTANAFFVALRNDGLLGSGTMTDPWDGNVIQGPPLATTLQLVSELNVSLSWASVNGVPIATVNTGANAHGCSVGDFVTIKDAVDYNGDFQIVEVVSGYVFKYALPAAPITGGASPKCRPAIVIATTASAHGLTDHDLVKIEGVTQDAAPSEYYNGTFVIYSVTSTTFRVRIVAPPTEPEGSSVTCRKVVFRFDEVLKRLGTTATPDEQVLKNTALHIGPGVFETRGSGGGWLNTNGARQEVWTPKEGQKLIGSGIGVTTLQLVVAEVPQINFNYYTLGTADYLLVANNAQIADLTVDCNMEAHPFGKPYSTIVKSAINLLGSHARIERVRAIDFGTQDIDVECFPFIAAGAHTQLMQEIVNSVIRECIVELPSPNNVREVTCMLLAATTPGYHRACQIRRNYVNCEYPGGKSSQLIAITDLTLVSGTTTYQITTNPAHGRTPADPTNNVTISLVQVPTGDPASPWKLSKVFNGTFAIESKTDTTIDFKILAPADGASFNLSNAVTGTRFQGFTAEGGAAAIVADNFVYHIGPANYHDTWSTKSIVVRNNRCFQVYWLDFQFLFGLDSAFNTGNLVEDGSIASDGLIATFTAVDDHGLIEKQGVRVSGVTPPGSHFNGIFEVEVLSPTEFQYTMNDTADPLAAGVPKFDRLQQVLIQFIENNLCELVPNVQNNYVASVGIALNGGRTTAPFSFPQSVIRGNWIQSGGGGNNFPMGLGSAPKCLVQDNVAVFPPAYPIRTEWSNPTCLNNQTSAGKLVPGLDVGTGRLYLGLNGAVEDSLTASFL